MLRMHHLSNIFQQLLMAVLLSLLAQYRFLERQAEQQKQLQVPIQRQYLNISSRVRAVDEQLQQLAALVNSSREIVTLPSSGPTMKSADQLLLARNVLLDVPQPCGRNHGYNLTLLVLVLNRVEDFDRRQIIRQTFGSVLKGNSASEIYFMVARNYDDEQELQLKEEAQQFQDIVQVDYPEDYYNCTVKGIALIRWAALHCPFVKYVFKFDDDSFMRVNPLLAELQRIEATAVGGLLSSLDEVARSNTSKWAISKETYPQVVYPSFIRGVYLIPGQLTIRLYEAIVSEPRANTLPALPFEDVYISGILPAKAAIARVYMECFILAQHEVVYNNTALLAQHSVFFNSLTIEKLKHLWDLFGPN